MNSDLILVWTWAEHEHLVSRNLLKTDDKLMKWGEWIDDAIPEAWMNGDECTISEIY